MSKIRHRTKTLAVLTLIAAAPAFATAPVAAQDDDPPLPVEVFIFENAMTNPDDNDDGVPDIRWQVQVTVTPLGGCTPGQGDGLYVSYWLDAIYPDTVTLSTEECVFQFEAVARDELTPECTFRAQIAWSDDNGNPTGDYVEGAVNTAGRPGGETRLLIRRAPGSGCEIPDQTHFVINGSTIVEDIPAASADSTLLALARQAGEIGEYTVRVEPEASALRAGCDTTTTFTVRSNGERSSQELGAVGPACPSRAWIIAAPAHVRVADGRHVAFNPAYPNILVDLTSLVRIESARIAIIQDVRGSGNQGEVIYTITRFCGGTALDSPAAQASTSTLFEGRFTVHSPDLPQFGPVATYPAVAAGATSTSVAGCSVTVTVGGVRAGCEVSGGNSQTLMWTPADPIAHFDFEFDFYCGGATPPTPAETQPPPGAEDMIPAEDAVPLVEDAGATAGDTGGAQDAEPAAEPAGPPRDAPTG